MKIPGRQLTRLGVISGAVQAPEQDQARTRISVFSVAELHDEAIAPGARLGSYNLEEECGRGGFGTVYRARHALTGIQVALKVLHPSLAISESMVLRFEREAGMLTRLNHPNIVQVLEVLRSPEGVPYFVMEWLEGITLEESLARRGVMSPEEIAPIATQVCSALTAAHAEGIVHRDIKGENVMLTYDSDGRVRVKLLDFGIAKLVGGEFANDGLTTTGTALGTAPYMAPEQIMRHPLSPKSDIYAVGVLLFRMMSGRYPHIGATTVQTICKAIYDPAPRLRKYAPVTDEVDELLLRCLAKNPADRPATPEEVAEMLSSAIERRTAQPDAGAQQVEKIYGILVNVEASPDADVDVFDSIDDLCDLAVSSLEELGLEILDDSGSFIFATKIVTTAEDSELLHEGLAEIGRRLHSQNCSESIEVSLMLHSQPKTDKISIDELWSHMLSQSKPSAHSNAEGGPHLVVVHG